VGSGTVTSKKFTPAEVKYGIPEKEMYAIFCAVEKFEYELRGRMFKIETDHKALSEIGEKADFNNARANRLVEKIQEFDFEINYRKSEEMVVSNSISRIYKTDEAEKKKIIEARGDKQIRDKRNKHVKEIDVNNIWVFDSGREEEKEN
jgi:hypothetical protein